MLLKQPGQGNVVTPFLSNLLKFNATPTQKDDLSEMPGFLWRSLTILICGEVSMLNASIRKMFHLYMFVLESVKSLFQKEIFVNMQNSAKFVWHVFHCQESLLNEW